MSAKYKHLSTDAFVKRIQLEGRLRLKQYRNRPVSLVLEKTQRLSFFKRAIGFGIAVDKEGYPSIPKTPALQWLLKKGYLKRTRMIGWSRGRTTILKVTDKGMEWFKQQQNN